VDDLEDLLLLWGQARDEASAATRAVAGTAPEHLRPRLRESLLGDDVHILVARHEGAAAGYALLRVAPVFAITDGPCLHVEHLFVAPSARRRGVAKALLAGVASVAERSGADQVITSVAPAARDTHRFLARLGFSPLVVRRVASTAVLRRKLAGESRRGSLDDLLSRRRSLRGKASWTAGRSSARATAAVVAEPAGLPRALPHPGLPDRAEVGALPMPAARAAALIDLDALAGDSSHPHDTLEMPIVAGDLVDALAPVARHENPSTQPA
jgi:GNAT superfamily N-acetyltransferase